MSTELGRISSYARIFVIGVALASSMGLIHAEANQDSTSQRRSESISLKDAIQEALDRNPEIGAAKFEALTKEAQIGPRGAYDDPMIEVEAMNYPVDTLSSREFGMTGTQVSLSQKLPFPGKLSKLRQAATNEYRSSQQAYNARQLEVIRDVKVAYFQLFLAQKRKVILAERQNVVRQLIVVTRNKYTLGKAPQAELLAMQVEEVNLLNQGLDLDKSIEARSADLAALLGRNNNTIFGSIQTIDRAEVDFTKVTVEALTERVLERTPSLKSAEADFAAAEARHSYAKWNYLPDFEVFFRYTFRQPNMDDRGVDTMSGGIAMSLPIWALTKQSQEARASAAEESRADAMLTRQRNDLYRQVRSLHAELRELSKRSQLFEGALLPLSKQAVVTGRVAYVAGKLEYVALLNAINTRYQTEQDYFDTLTNLQIKIAEVEGLTGEPIGALK